jgi:hypothetical protein
VGYALFQLQADATAAQHLVAQVLMANQFRVTWHTPLTGIGERGSRGANIALGAMAQYYGIEFEIFPGDYGVVVRLVQANSGMAGGLIGYSSVKKTFASVCDRLAWWFQANILLIGYTKGKVAGALKAPRQPHRERDGGLRPRKSAYESFSKSMITAKVSG